MSCFLVLVYHVNSRLGDESAGYTKDYRVFSYILLRTSRIYNLIKRVFTFIIRLDDKTIEISEIVRLEK